jgi:hypothetical protein
MTDLYKNLISNNIKYMCVFSYSFVLVTKESKRQGEKSAACPLSQNNEKLRKPDV